MRLTELAKLAAGIVLVALAGAALFVSRPALAPLLAKDAPAERDELATTRRSLVYRVPAAQPVRFIFSRPGTIVRITSQPNIAPADWRSDRTWVYGFRAVFRDGDDEIVASHDIYSRALHPDRLRPFKRPVRFRRGSDVPIALQDEAVIETPRPAASVELTALDAAPGVQSVDARVYERLPFIGTTALSTFRRRTSDEQAEMARADAFPPALLSDAERTALMTNRWKVVGPAGIAGRDYQVDVVYERPFEGDGGGEGGEE